MASWDDKALFGAGGFKPPGSGPSVIPEAHYAAIGKIVDVWADLEFAVDMTIWDILGEEQALYACVTAQLVSILPKLDALISLAKRLKAPAQVVQSIKRFQSRMGGLVKERNRVIHDHRVIWYGDGAVARFEVSAKGGLRFEPVSESVTELLQLRARIDQLIDEFNAIRAELAAAIPSSEDRLRAQPFRTKRMKGPPAAPPSDSK